MESQTFAIVSILEDVDCFFGMVKEGKRAAARR